MFYREAGQFKSSYETDGQIFPIRQDRIGILLLIGLAFVAIPLVATPYFFSAILIPFLIFSLAALGLNILTGYAGQLSLGSAAFMAVGAFSAYNFVLRVPGIPLLAAFILGGLCAAAVGIVFGLPSLRVRGFYLAASTLATQFFCGLGVDQGALVHQLQFVGRDHCTKNADSRRRFRYTRIQIPAGAFHRRGAGAAGQEHGAIEYGSLLDGGA